MKVRNAAASAAICVLGLMGTLPATAQDAAAAAAFNLELNKAETKVNAETKETACQLTFVVKNDTGTKLTKAGYEMAIFDTNGQVSTLISFGFEDLPLARRKVYQFGLKDQACESIGAISINRITDCNPGDGSLSAVCDDMLKASSKLSIQFP